MPDKKPRKRRITKEITFNDRFIALRTSATDEFKKHYKAPKVRKMPLGSKIGFGLIILIWVIAVALVIGGIIPWPQYR